MVTPPWMHRARNKLGQHEIKGDVDNQYILSCHALCNLNDVHDELPWCSSAMNDFFINGANIEGTRSASALSWLDWGIKLAVPVYGCVVIFRRPPNPKHGHVNLYLFNIDKNPAYGRAYDELAGIGGNQRNSISIDFYRKDHVLGYRWPNEYYLDGSLKTS